VGLEQVSTLMQDMMMTTLIVSAPMLLAALVIGLAISIFQAATQINEQTLSFVPKIVVVFGVFGALFPWMMQLIMEFNGRIMGMIAGTGGP
jgi:flagellar biosynthesis protein FliQ